MNSPNNPRLCPCGSGEPFNKCCLPFIKGEANPTHPEQLMRSRYSAYATQNYAYILTTYCESTKPALSVEELVEQNHSVNWLGLKIIASVKAQQTGTVSFEAFYKEHKQAYCLAEHSQFRIENGLWRYVNGEMLENCGKVKVGRNDACLCGSGRKAKRCCFT